MARIASSFSKIVASVDSMSAHGAGHENFSEHGAFFCLGCLRSVEVMVFHSILHAQILAIATLVSTTVLGIPSGRKSHALLQLIETFRQLITSRTSRLARLLNPAPQTRGRVGSQDVGIEYETCWTSTTHIEYVPASTVFILGEGKKESLERIIQLLGTQV